MDIEQVYHPWHLWEDHKHGFYNNVSGLNKKKLEANVLELFSNESMTLMFMTSVIDNWVYSCEHNFTNPSINKIAYLGQAACCLAYKVPATVTMSYWRNIPLESRGKADKIAKKLIDNWIKNYKNAKDRT